MERGEACLLLLLLLLCVVRPKIAALVSMVEDPLTFSLLLAVKESATLLGEKSESVGRGARLGPERADWFFRQERRREDSTSATMLVQADDWLDGGIGGSKRDLASDRTRRKRFDYMLPPLSDFCSLLASPRLSDCISRQTPALVSCEYDGTHVGITSSPRRCW